MPALEALLNRYCAANTQPLGISVDSVHSHANWARDLGGVSFPLLSDFHPKGEMARSYGAYLDDLGITDRATVIVDVAGTVRHASSVTPAGKRNLEELAALCERVNAGHDGALEARVEPPGLEPGSTLFVKSRCGFSRAVLLAMDNLHISDALPVLNVTEDPAAMAKLRELTGNEQAPCLVAGGEAMLESADIIRYLATRVTGL